MGKKILHILPVNTFTIPFVKFINSEFNEDEHLFLFNSKPSDDLLSTFQNIYFLRGSKFFKYNILINIFLYIKLSISAKKIVIHGLPPLQYFFCSPMIFFKIYWVIYGYEIYYNNLNANFFHKLFKKLLLKKVYGHITHIEGDSRIANNMFGSKARYFYSPTYLSNIVDSPFNFSHHRNQKNTTYNILIGNSASSSNNHSTIFKMLEPYKNSDINIYCPLSYGNSPGYVEQVSNEGMSLFTEKFFPITKFMSYEDYKKFLSNIDIAVFNHYRQEAMGLIITLLSMNKVVYMNELTTSYASFSSRGIKVFSNKLISYEGLFKERDVSNNSDLVFKYYNQNVLKDSLIFIFQD